MTHQAPRGRHKQQTPRQPPPYDNERQGPYPPPGQYTPPPQGQYAPPYSGYQQGPGQPPHGPPQEPGSPLYQQGPGPQYVSAPPQRKKRHWQLYTLLGISALVVLIVVVTVVLTGGGASAVTIKGTVTPSSGASSVFGAGVNATTYAGCAAASPMPGTQITVTDPSGKVIGTGTLGVWADSSVTTSGLTVYLCDMPFTIKNVPSEQRYGFSINGVPGTIWETSVSGPVNLSVSGSSG